MTMRRMPFVMALTAVLLLGACANVPTDQPQRTSGSPATSQAVQPSSLASLAQPRVAPVDPARPRYVREEWQPNGWGDADGDGCDTREEVLIAESAVPPRLGLGCKIVVGEWVDRYTGRRVTAPAALQIDHLVALSDAHASGGWEWPGEKKVAFANDVDDSDQLNATWGPENQRKSDDGPDRWLPPNTAFRCAYVASYAAIKARWDLAVTPTQWAAIEQVWASCAAPS